MKLNSEQAQHVADQLEGQIVPEEHPSAAELKQALGDHTFFLNGSGLHVVEPDTSTDNDDDAAAIKIGSWAQGADGQLYIHEPQPVQAVTLKAG